MTPYDRWRLTPPDTEIRELGTKVGEICNRYLEPDEDAPRGYHPKPCTGTMERDECGCCIWCDTCGEYA